MGKSASAIPMFRSLLGSASVNGGHRANGQPKEPPAP
jgi:hypothetical protein